MRPQVRPVFSQNLAITAGLVFVLAITFAAYARGEHDVDEANATRINSLLLAGELRQSSRDLTRMARSYVTTGDSSYRKYYQTILDVRDGKSLRPEGYLGFDPDLFPSTLSLNIHRDKPIALLDLMRQAGFTPTEFNKVAEAKANSDDLTRIEFVAMNLAGTRGPQGAANRARAIEMLYDDVYSREKASIMTPIDEFASEVDHRTQAAVDRAMAMATFLRYAFIVVGLALIVMLWATYTALRKMMGGSVNAVYVQIAALGSGNFVAPSSEKLRPRDSVLGWLSAARAKLDEARTSSDLDSGERGRAEEALRQSEQRTRLIIDTALDAVITMTSSGVISDWSAQAERMFGWSRAEAIGRPMAETIIPHRYREGHNRGLKKFLATGEGPILNKRIEVIALGRDGREFPVELAISPAKVGAEWAFSAFIRDLTEQKKIEKAAKLGEERYRDLFEDIPVGLYRSTPAGHLIDVNPAMVSMLRYPNREALLATPAPSLYIDPTDRLRWTAQLAGNGVVLDFDVRMQRADGTVIWVRDTTHVKRGPDGRVLLYEGVLEDITQRVEAAHAVKDSERRHIQILEAAPLGILVSDAAGIPVFANAAAQEILGEGVVPGRVASALAHVYKAYIAGTDQLYPVERMPLIRALAGEVEAVDDIEIRHGDRVVSLHVQGAPIRNAEGVIVGSVAAFFDSTDKRVMESQLRQTSKMEAVGQLAGGVAHDFNNLLTVIMSYTAMLLDDLDASNPLHADLREIAAAADRAAGLTRQLLAFSRQQVMQPRVLDINAVVGDVQTMLRRIIGEDIELRITLGADVDRINADPGQLEQVLMNLVVNARDAMPAGGRLTITTSNAELSKESAAGALEAPDGAYVMVSVSDTGTGMHRDVQQRLFDPFFTTKDQGRGTGLGLSTVYGIVKQSGGEIYVYSEVGQGSTFKVYFPRFAAAGEVEEPERASIEVCHGTESLLLVEDDDNLRNLVARVLTGCGYTVFVATGGAEALAIANHPETQIDAVISDVVMSGMNGRQLVEKLLESRPGMGVLLMSGYTDDDVLRRGVLHGETAFLQKPFTPDQLSQKVRAVMDRALVASVASKI
jgi:two-component system cell cycle sensor histidine kinase/response regulator CckA